MKDPTNISFPGLGIGEFTLDKIAFSIGPLDIRWYALFITMGIVLSFLYTGWRGKKNENVIFDDIIDIGLWTVTLGVIGARAYYVLTTLNDPNHDYDSFIDLIAVWNGGLAIYGGIIGGCLGIVIACLIKKIKWQKAFDMIAPSVMLAQALGRWGNFFNGEAFGYPIGEQTKYYFFNTEFSLRSGEGTFFNLFRMGVSQRNYPIVEYYHPTFLYECVWNLLGFALINIFYKHKKFDGQIALMYFGWYGFGRMFIEGFRTDSLYIPGTTLRISQCLGFACFIVSAILIAVFLLLPVIRRKTQGSDANVAPVAETAMPAAEETVKAEAQETVEEANEICSNEEKDQEKSEESEDGKLD